MGMELLAAAIVVTVTGGAIFAGVTLGGRYVDGKLRYEEKTFTENDPIVLSKDGKAVTWRVTKSS